MTYGAFPDLRAPRLVATLDLGPDAPICLLCLSIVSFALDRGDRAEIACETRRVTQDLWAEGLAEPAVAAVRRACERGVEDAEWALVDLERNGADSAVARAIVRHLAAELSRRTRTQLRVEVLARERLGLSPPELN